MKILYYLVALGLGGLGVVQQAGIATALDFSFIYTAAGVTTSGIFHTTETQFAGQFQVTGISGTRGGTESISYLAPTVYGNNDNFLYTTNNNYFSTRGVSYATNNALYNIYRWDDGTFNETSSPIINTSNKSTVGIDSINVVQGVPFEFNPAEGAALGVPLFIGLRILSKKRLTRKLTASETTKTIS